MPRAVNFRPLVAADQALLWDLLHIALWDPPPAGLRPREVLDDRRVRIHSEQWGAPTDVGAVAEDAHARTPLGACWMRLVADGQGLGYVDEQTPQLGIALFPDYQHPGHGEPLMRAALDAGRSAGYRQVSLTVHPRNPATALCEPCGFRKTAMRNGYHLMVVALAVPPEQTGGKA